MEAPDTTKWFKHSGTWTSILLRAPWQQQIEEPQL